MSQKIHIYISGCNKPVTLTDDENNKNLSSELANLFESKKVVKFETSTDILLIRPSRIDAILVSDDSIKKESKSIPPKIDTPTSAELPSESDHVTS